MYDAFIKPIDGYLHVEELLKPFHHLYDGLFVETPL